MSEIPVGSRDNGKRDSNIINLDSVRRKRNEDLSLSEYSDVDMVDLFMSQIYHPGAPHGPSELARYVRKLLGDRVDEQLTEEQQAWRERMSDLMVDIDDIDDDTLNTWLDQDTVLGEMYETLRNTRSIAKDMAEERAALLRLRHLRAGMISRSETEGRDGDRWLSLIRKLGHATLR